MRGVQPPVEGRAIPVREACTGLRFARQPAADIGVLSDGAGLAAAGVGLVVAVLPVRARREISGPRVLRGKGGEDEDAGKKDSGA